MSILLGAIADDFTGATDLASTLVNQGMRVTLVIGVPDADTEIGYADAIVVALKSRTETVDNAISKSLSALSCSNHTVHNSFFQVRSGNPEDENQYP